MSKGTACPPNIGADTIIRTIELGVTITDAAVDEHKTTIFCAPVARNPRCPDCGHDGRYRDTTQRVLADLPVAGFALVLDVAVPRCRCVNARCGRAIFSQDLAGVALPRSSTTRRCARYVLWRLMIDRTTVSAIAAELRVSWHTVNTIAMRAVVALVAAAGADRLAGVKVIGVDARLTAVFADDAHIAVAVTWSVYQYIIAAYADPNRRTGKRAMTKLVGIVGGRLPLRLRLLDLAERALQSSIRRIR